MAEFQPFVATDSKEVVLENRRKEERAPLPVEADLSFIVDEAEMEVKDVDISSSGIGFTTEQPLGIKVRIKYDNGQNLNRTAQLVWTKKEETGEMRYGFRFVEE